MKRIFLMAVAALFFVACQNQTETTVENTTETKVVEGPIAITVGSFDEKAAKLVGQEVMMAKNFF
jgi:PBP1b-binding outer membrane lipoprotein LpoB